MGALIARIRHKRSKNRRNVDSSSSRKSTSSRHSSIASFFRRKSKTSKSSSGMSLSEEEEPEGWFPKLSVFPDEPVFTIKSLRDMRKWHLRNEARNFLPPLKDVQLLLFVHSNCKDLAEAKLCILKYYTSMVDMTFLFDHWTLEDEDMKKAFDSIFFTIMPVEHPDGYKIMILRLRTTEPDMFQFKDAAKAVLMSTEAMLLIEGPPKAVVVIMDVTGMKMGHFTRLHMNEVKQFLNLVQSDRCVQDVLPIIVHQVEVINCNYLVPLIMAAVRPFLTSSLSSVIRIHTSSDMDSFYARYPKSCLPAEYKGDLEGLEVYHNTNIDRIRKLIPYWEERQSWIDNRRHHHKFQRLHAGSHSPTTAGTATSQPVTRTASPT